MMLFFTTTGCKKGQAFRFGDQDLFAFGAQDSCHFTRNNLGVRISWKGSMPVNMIIHRSVPEKYDPEIISAANRWNTAAGRTLMNVKRDNGIANEPGNDRKNIIYWSSDWDSANSKEQARTISYTDLSRIIDSDIKINAKNFSFVLTTQTSGSSAVNLESLILHEMGHVLGLQHFEGSGIMSTHLASGKLRFNFSSEELSELSCEY
jgi:hypothetical protein